jgi:hypothetical protein
MELDELKVGYGEFEPLPRVGMSRLEEFLCVKVGTPLSPSLEREMSVLDYYH